jgi:hypothetical protein
LNKPTLRAESVLDGIFSESVVVLEADGDRLVYQTTWETLSADLRVDVHFAAVGGTGGIADICKLYRTLYIPVAVVVDLDIVVDLDKLSRIVNSLIPSVQADEIIKDAKVVAEEILKTPPTINPGDFRQRLKDIEELPAVWENNDDSKISKKLRNLAQDLDRLRRLKSGGVSGLPEKISTPLKKLINQLSAVGVFLVPVGELEGWLASERTVESKANKSAWANAAALKIQSKGSSEGDVWDFLRTVGAYLKTVAT